VRADAESDPKVEIAHVLTMDVVGYSNLLITEQSQVIAELTRIVKETPRCRRAEAEGKLIRVPTGDGMLLVFFDDPQAPVQAAIEIATALKSHPKIRLRMGIHSGPVNEIVDVNDRSNVAGAGVDMAQRVMDCGDAGHILLSKRVADDLAPFPRWNPHLHDLGECEVKHGRKISLVNFYTDTVGNPQTPKKCALAKPKPLLARQRALIGATVLLILALIIGSLIFLRQTASGPGTTATSSASQPNSKSIAVLPFENLSHDPDNAYFADGIQEEILTRLSKIADLKVISRTSTQRYKSKPDNLPEIAKQLGVANILEGTVQKAADQVRVNVQLISARNDSHLWADKFDRKLTDIFAVETEIASKIADTLQAQLTGSAKQAIAAHPTQNTEAHELYLRGRYFVGKRGAENFRKAIDYFNQAIAKDPNYALAYAGLSDCYDLLPQWSAASRAEYVPKAKAAAIKALQIDDSLAEAHTALASALFSNDLNLRESKREFERAIELNPNYAFAHYSFGYTVLPALGEFDRAIAELRRAVDLDPFSVIINANLGYVYIVARRYPDAIAQLRKTVELDPDFWTTHRNLGEALELGGQLEQAIAEYEKGYKFLNDDHALAYLAHAYALKGEREKALQLLTQLQELEQHGTLWAFGFALVYVGLGDKNEAVNWLERSYQNKEFAKLSLIKVEPMLDPLRGDPRFEKLANQIVPPNGK
jgi:TolB-like protein/Flp pilus assembly protein TadD/class 3 adenylate cyclase